MKKNKGLKIAAIVVGVLLLLMALIPFVFEGKVATIVKSEGNKMLNARFDFQTLNISLFKHFPKASLTLKDFYLVGAGEFEKDTLVRAGEVTLAVDLLSLLGDQYEVGKVLLKDAAVHAIVLENGKVNWDIMKSDTTSTPEEETTEDTASAFNLQLKKLEVKNLDIVYNDYQSKTYAAVKGFNAECSGDFSADLTELKLKAAVEQLSFRMGVIPYLSNAKLEAKINVEADLKNQKYTFLDNSLQLNAIQTSIDGWVSMPDTTRMEMDLKLNTNDIGFKEVLSLVPAIYKKDFADLKTDGTASLSAWAKGEMKGENLPAFHAELKVVNAMFRYPSLPAGVEAINVTAKASNPGGSANQTVIEINPLGFRMAGMPFSLTALVKTPVSDPDFKAEAKGTIDLAHIQKVYPLEEDMSFTGVLTADVQMAGRMSYIEKEQYDRFQASGIVNLKDMLLKMSDMKDVQINQSTLTFSPQNVKLSQTDILIGQNDLSLECTLENYLAYLLQDKTIRGTVNLNSNYLNLADLLGSEEVVVSETDSETSEETASETPLSVIEVPNNVDFKMQANLKKILFDTMTFGNVNGLLLIKDGTVDMKNLSLETMDGQVTINGAYSTAENVKAPTLNGSFKLSNLSFSQTYKELDMVRNLAPVFENLQGKFSGTMQLATTLDTQMSPILETMSGNGNLSTSEVNLSNIEILQKVASLAQKNDLLSQNVKDLNIKFAIAGGRLITEPFTLKLGSQYSMQLAGSTGLDQTIDYKGTIALPTGEKSLLSSVGLTIGGTFTSPKIGLDTKSMASEALNAVSSQALSAVGEKLGIDLSTVEKQKETLVSEAQKAGVKLVEEAQKQADKLLEDAGSNVLKQAATKVAAQKLVETAQKQADKLVQEAEEKGDALIEKAKKAE